MRAHDSALRSARSDSPAMTRLGKTRREECLSFFLSGKSTQSRNLLQNQLKHCTPLPIVSTLHTPNKLNYSKITTPLLSQLINGIVLSGTGNLKFIKQN